MQGEASTAASADAAARASEAESAASGGGTRLGIALMLLGLLMFALNDVMGKWLVSTYSVGQVLFIRSFAGLLILSPMAWRLGRKAFLKPEQPKRQALRVVFASVEVFCFYAAVAYLPLADVMTYWLATPIYIAALSPLMLGESVGWRRWTAIVVGFAGVVVALEPSAATLTWPALISVIGSFIFALTLIFSRQLRGTPDTVLVFWHIAGSGLLGLVILPFGWVTPTVTDLGLLSLLGIVAMLAHVCVNRALKLSPASVLAPFHYTLLIWALLFGYVFFDEVPRQAMLIGAAIIVASGLFIVLRENSLGRVRAPIEPP